MKRISIVLIAVLAVICVSCETNLDDFQVAEDISPVLAELNFTNLELDGNNTNNPAVTFSWQEATYSIPSAVRYAIQFSADESFTNPVVAATTIGETSKTLSMAEVNGAAGNAGLPPFAWNSVFARVVASLGSEDTLENASNTIVFSVFPYFNYTFDDYYLVGDATSPGWDNNNNNPAVYRDPNDENRFYYTGFFADNGHFKLLSILGQWQPQWGTNDGTSVSDNPGGGNDPERFPYGGGDGIPAGFYTFTIDFTSNTFTFEPFDATGITSPAGLSLQGSGVASAITMTPLDFDGHIWQATGVRLTPGEVTFLTDAGAVWGSDTSFSGIATENGGSIPVVVEDDYDIWFNDLTGDYILIPQNL
ncbi:MAG: SusE domain-containing protein [Flavobacteriaceae bacterium]|nr:SusE domain-containing protein [Flavobacteriaceae bacterium]